MTFETFGSVWCVRLWLMIALVCQYGKTDRGRGEGGRGGGGRGGGGRGGEDYSTALRAVVDLAYKRRYVHTVVTMKASLYIFNVQHFRTLNLVIIPCGCRVNKTT